MPPRERKATAPPVALVIFGASGDLTRRKLAPALFNLFRAGRLSEHFAIMGVSRSPLTDAGFREAARQGILDHSGNPQIAEDVWR
ncbi:MAG TPA: glucose-6-phosphate dehydrogenase, partial [Chloroflexota bacterium]|nr:glucose-6-phosphate dehydrogenase [Chloroflexota bacterium]